MRINSDKSATLRNVSDNPSKICAILRFRFGVVASLIRVSAKSDTFSHVKKKLHPNVIRSFRKDPVPLYRETIHEKKLTNIRTIYHFIVC
uniref:Uncharacterized protein n=1 Tax=Glossina morsitans morsitans TaxID=37546 RepID=A0A1A9YUE1_GLOMM